MTNPSCTCKPRVDDFPGAHHTSLKCPLHRWPQTHEQRQHQAAYGGADPGAELRVDYNDPSFFETTPGARLTTDREARKAIPVATGCLDYFPDALAAVAECSYVATQQHHPGEPLHWDRRKSPDEADALIRHFLERGTVDTDGVRHSAKVAWRALALLQKEIEAARS